MLHIQQLIQQFNLLPHPEGGWYKETYRSAEMINASLVSDRFSGSRTLATAIYFLLEEGNFSAFHKIKSDECWHFYAGDALEIFVLDDAGGLTITRLGNDMEQGDLYQYVVPANHWFASRPALGSHFCFVGCTVSPGFDFADFEMAKAETLLKQYPQHRTIIEALCRF